MQLFGCSFSYNIFVLFIKRCVMTDIYIDDRLLALTLNNTPDVGAPAVIRRPSFFPLTKVGPSGLFALVGL